MPARRRGSSIPRGIANRTRPGTRWATKRLSVNEPPKRACCLRDRSLFVQLEKAVECPVEQLIPARVAQPGAVPHEIAESESGIYRRHRETQVDVSARHKVQLLVRPAGDAFYNRGSGALR